MLNFTNSQQTTDLPQVGDMPQIADMLQIVDLHTHILPGVDDGVATIEEAIKVLQAERGDGVGKVALTPHFYSSLESVDSFLERRDDAFRKLYAIISRKDFMLPELMLGAEVAFSAELAEIKLDGLRYEGTRSILIEMPKEHLPQYTRDVFYEIMIRGFRPVIAHAERYLYFERDPEALETLIDAGALSQVTAEAILYGGRTGRRVLKMIKNGTAHIIATDTHGLTRRPPCLKAALTLAKKKTGIDLTNGTNL